jgi:hypothetical protein
VLKIGQDKSGKDRRIKLPDVTAEFFEAAAKDKLPTAPLLSRADGKAWNKDAWKWPIKAAVEVNRTPFSGRHEATMSVIHGHLRSDVAAGALARLTSKIARSRPSERTEKGPPEGGPLQPVRRPVADQNEWLMPASNAVLAAVADVWVNLEPLVYR